jgi:hypothetical protein
MMQNQTTTERESPGAKAEEIDIADATEPILQGWFAVSVCHNRYDKVTSEDWFPLPHIFAKILEAKELGGANLCDFALSPGAGRTYA